VGDRASGAAVLALPVVAQPEQLHTPWWVPERLRVRSTWGRLCNVPQISRRDATASVADAQHAISLHLAKQPSAELQTHGSAVSVHIGMLVQLLSLASRAAAVC
jgi:hypothetical protein